jgi:hypothetical protein
MVSLGQPESCVQYYHAVVYFWFTGRLLGRRLSSQDCIILSKRSCMTFAGHLQAEQLLQGVSLVTVHMGAKKLV